MDGNEDVDEDVDGLRIGIKMRKGMRLKIEMEIWLRK